MTTSSLSSFVGTASLAWYAGRLHLVLAPAQLGAQLSASSAALDLAPLSQTPPRHGFRFDGARTSEWPPFAGQRPNGENNNTATSQCGTTHGRTVTTGSLASERTSPTTSRHLPPPNRSVTVDAGRPSPGRSTSPTIELTSPKKSSLPATSSVPSISTSPEDKRRSLIGHAGSAPALNVSADANGVRSLLSALCSAQFKQRLVFD